ncbi:hypothetical protein DID75_03485 [Candidatus Marinamargulisbacteria bacterium SCGC AG-410-N11]|nr:hypothetical protein DID75_03485 [Candidatus Marinamargulisbacteria bacterium SCGC AG-410-N11]
MKKLMSAKFERCYSKILTKENVRKAHLKQIQRNIEQKNDLPYNFRANNLITEDFLMGQEDLSFVKIVKLDNHQATDQVLEKFETLTTIDLKGCVNFTKTGLQHLTSLETVSFQNCSQVNDEYLQHLPSSVKSIDLRGCSNITDKGLTHLSNAEAVYLGNNPNVTINGLSNLQNVSRISLSKKFIFKNKSIFDQLPNLEKINNHLTNYGVKVLTETTTTTTIDLTNNPFVTNDVFDHLKKAEIINFKGSYLTLNTGNKETKTTATKETKQKVKPHISSLTNALKINGKYTNKGLTQANMVKINGNMELTKNADRLLLKNNSFITPEGLSNLPEIITHVTIINCKHIDAQALSNRPETITHLTLDGQIL